MLKTIFSKFGLFADGYTPSIITARRPTPRTINGKKAWKNRGKVSSKKYQARR